MLSNSTKPYITGLHLPLIGTGPVSNGASGLTCLPAPETSGAWIGATAALADTSGGTAATGDTRVASALELEGDADGAAASGAASAPGCAGAWFEVLPPAFVLSDAAGDFGCSERLGLGSAGALACCACAAPASRNTMVTPAIVVSIRI